VAKFLFLIMLFPFVISCAHSQQESSTNRVVAQSEEEISNHSTKKPLEVRCVDNSSNVRNVFVVNFENERCELFQTKDAFEDYENWPDKQKKSI